MLLIANDELGNWRLPTQHVKHVTVFREIAQHMNMNAGDGVT